MNGNKRLTYLLENAEITEPAEGTGTKDILKNYLEDYCLNRVKKDDFEDLKNMVEHIQKMNIITLFSTISFINIYLVDIGKCSIKEHHRC